MLLYFSRRSSEKIPLIRFMFLMFLCQIWGRVCVKPRYKNLSTRQLINSLTRQLVNWNITQPLCGSRGMDMRKAGLGAKCALPCLQIDQLLRSRLAVECCYVKVVVGWLSYRQAEIAFQIQFCFTIKANVLHGALCLTCATMMNA